MDEQRRQDYLRLIERFLNCASELELNDLEVAPPPTAEASTQFLVEILQCIKPYRNLVRQVK